MNEQEIKDAVAEIMPKPPEERRANPAQIEWAVSTMARLGYDGRVHPDIPPRLGRYLVAAVKGWTNKGLILSGAVGVGKTMFFDRVLRAIYPEFVLWRASQIVELATTHRENFEEICYGRYDDQNLFSEAVLAIDDLGEEPHGNVYGNKGEVLARVICDRYETWKRRGIRCFVSTNLSMPEISARYGDRVTDRLGEMCYAIRLNGQSARGTK
jgi:DNA replication protein DnaC